MSAEIESKISTKVKQIVDSLLPNIKDTVLDLLSGKINLLKQELKKDVEASIWDKAMLEIGKVTNLPPEIITKLQQVDDLVSLSKTELKKEFSELKETYVDYLNRIGDTDLNKNITISMRDFTIAKFRVGGLCGLLCFWLGYFITH